MNPVRQATDALSAGEEQLLLTGATGPSGSFVHSRKHPDVVVLVNAYGVEIWQIVPERPAV